MQPIDLHQGANADGAAISASVCGWSLTREKSKIVDVTTSTIHRQFSISPIPLPIARFDLIIVNAMRLHCKPSNRLKFGLDLDTESMNGVAHPGLFQTGMPTQRGVPTYYLAKCLQKMHGNERTLTVRDVLAPSWIRHWNEWAVLIDRLKICHSVAFWRAQCFEEPRSGTSKH